jgi:regulator of sigma E protease
MTWLLWKVLVPIAIVGVLIVIHELGHFLVAKWCGVGVVKFSIGFGPSILRWKGKETIYQLSIIPLGGFVRMVGDIPDGLTGPQKTDAAVRAEEDDEETEPEDEIPEELLRDRSKWFIEKNLWQRSAIVFAGPFANFVSAFLFVAIAIALYGRTNLDESPIIGAVDSTSPAEAAGLKEGDVVLSVASDPINSWEQLAKRIHLGPAEGDTLTLQVRRGEAEIPLVVTPKFRELRTFSGEKQKVFLIGIAQQTIIEPVPLSETLTSAASWTYGATMGTYEGLWGMVTGKVSPDELAGPLFIFDAAGKQAKKGMENVYYFMAMLSISLAVLNLLPIPVLDGGHLLFFLLEGLLGPISIRKKEIAQQVGLAFLLLLMGFAISNDIRRDPKSLEGKPSWEEESPPADAASSK